MKKRESYTRSCRLDLKNSADMDEYLNYSSGLIDFIIRYRARVRTDFDGVLHRFFGAASLQNTDKYFWVYRSFSDPNKIGYLTRRKALICNARFFQQPIKLLERDGLPQYRSSAVNDWIRENGQQISADRFLAGFYMFKNRPNLRNWACQRFMLQQCEIELSSDFETGYDMEFDDSQGSSRWNGCSCMGGRGEDAQYFYGGIDCLAIKVLDKSTKRQVGRSILWDCVDENGKKQLYVDRLYVRPPYADHALTEIDRLFPEAIKYDRGSYPKLTARATGLCGDTYAMYCDSFGYINASYTKVSTRGGACSIEMRSTGSDTLDDLASDDEDYRTCIHCEDSHHMDDMYYIDGEWVCDECRQEHYFTCAECGELHHYDDSNEANGDFYCNYCFERLFTNCDCCDKPVKHSDVVSVGDSSFCESCVEEHGTIECESCGGDVLDTDYYAIIGDDGLKRCNACNRRFVNIIEYHMQEYKDKPVVATATIRPQADEVEECANPTIHECVVAEF